MSFTSEQNQKHQLCVFFSGILKGLSCFVNAMANKVKPRDLTTFMQAIRNFISQVKLVE